MAFVRLVNVSVARQCPSPLIEFYFVDFTPERIHDAKIFASSHEIAHGSYVCLQVLRGQVRYESRVE